MAESRLIPRSEKWAQAAADRVVELVVSALDVNALLDQVDLNDVLDRIDLDRLLERIDLNEIVKRIDVEALVEQTDLGAVIAASSSGVAGEVLNVVRSQTVGLDEFIARWIGRLRRRPYAGPPGPPTGRGPGPGHDRARGRCPALRAPGLIGASLQGKYAGFASRFAAFAVDAAVSRRVHAGPGRHLVRGQGLTGTDIAWHKGDIWVVIAYRGLGVRLLRLFLGRERPDGRHGAVRRAGRADDGTDASGRRAVVRTLALPLSFLFLGLGFTGILLGDRRRALHDVIAGTAVIYSWDARAARLRFLSRG